MLGAKFGFGPSADCIARNSDPRLAQSIQGLSPSTFCATLSEDHTCALAQSRDTTAMPSVNTGDRHAGKESGKQDNPRD